MCMYDIKSRQYPHIQIAILCRLLFSHNPLKNRLRRNQQALTSLFSFLNSLISPTYLDPYLRFLSSNYKKKTSFHSSCRLCYSGMRSHLKSGCAQTVTQQNLHDYLLEKVEYIPQVYFFI